MSVVSVKKAELNKRNIANFQEWSERKDTMYIGCNMSFYVPGTNKSKWADPYSVKKYGREDCLKMYEEYIMKSELLNDLHELDGKELGCW